MQTAEYYMGEALAEARKAFDIGEIPVGAVIVRDGEIIARAYNSVERDKDPSCHAELKAIRQAAAKLGGWRLPGCSMYVTLEPCSMCAGAIVLARIENLYVGTADPKSGACGSLYNIVCDSRLNHRVKLFTGVEQQHCSEILKTFFRELRKH